METALQRNNDLERFVLVSLKKSNSKQLFADLERSEYDSVMKEFCDQLQKSHFSVQFNWITLGTFYNYNHHNPETNPLLCLERGSSSTGHYGSGGSERSQIGREMDQSLAESKGNQEICPSFKVGPCTLLREKEAPTHLRSDVSSATCRKNDAGVDLGLGLNPHENRYNTRSSALSIFTSERGQAKKCHLTGNGVDMHKAKKKKRQDKMPITRKSVKRKGKKQSKSKAGSHKEQTINFTFPFTAIINIRKVYTQKNSHRSDKYQSMFPKVDTTTKLQGTCSTENKEKSKEYVRQSNSNVHNENSRNVIRAKNSRKIYLSESHSKLTMDIPGVPPSTPAQDLDNRLEIVPCMSDKKSQRLMHSRLVAIESKRRKRDAQIKEAKENELKELEKRHKKEEIIKLKQQQRAEIYALNKIMAELELANFEKFVEQKAGLPV